MQAMNEICENMIVLIIYNSKAVELIKFYNII